MVFFRVNKKMDDPCKSGTNGTDDGLKDHGTGG